MTERAASGRGGLRRPTPREWVGLIVAEALVWLIAVVVDGYADWPPTPWIMAATMLLVLALWLRKLRSPVSSRRGASGERGARSTTTSHEGMSGRGSA